MTPLQGLTCWTLGLTVYAWASILRARHVERFNDAQLKINDLVQEEIRGIVASHLRFLNMHAKFVQDMSGILAPSEGSLRSPSSPPLVEPDPREEGD